MKVTVVVVRIFGTEDQYGAEPRTPPEGSPIRFEGFPDAASEARIEFGAVPPDLAEAGRNAFDLAREAQARTRQPLDILTTVASALTDARIFAHLVVDDRVLLFVDGKRPAGVPELGAHGLDLVIRAGDETLGRLSERLSLLQTLEPRTAVGESGLARVAHWHVQVLTERDPGKRFQWAFVALEVLTNELFARFARAGFSLTPGDWGDFGDSE